MEESNHEKPFNIGGLHPILFSSIMIILIAISSVTGYVLGLANLSDSPTCNVEVELKTDSVLMEIMRGQVKVEMEMLKVINEKTTQVAPIVKNIIRTEPTNCKPNISNSFNHNIVKFDSLSK